MQPQPSPKGRGTAISTTLKRVVSRFRKTTITEESNEPHAPHHIIMSGDEVINEEPDKEGDKPSSHKRQTSNINIKNGQETAATDVVHTAHVQFDSDKGEFLGLPKEWQSAVSMNFGIPLALCKSIEVEGYKSRIPKIVVDLKKYLIENGGQEVKGIFRLAPDQGESASVKAALNEDSFEGCADINCVSNAIKVFFRELPRAILSGLDAEKVKACDSDEMATSILNELTEPSLSIAHWLTDLICDIVDHSKVNLMSAKNMSIVFSPNLYKPDARSPMEILVLSKKFTDFYERVINNHLRTRLEAKGLAGDLEELLTGNDDEVEKLVQSRRSLIVPQSIQTLTKEEDGEGATAKEEKDADATATGTTEAQSPQSPAE